MPDARDHAHPVELDVSSLEIWGLQGSGYSAKLVGEVDDIWSHSFAEAQRQQSEPGRFYLDRTRNVIVFSTRAEEDPQIILEEARLLLDRANRRAGRRSTQIPIAAGRPTPDEETRRLTRPKTFPEPGVKRVEQGATRLEDSRESSRVGAALMVEFCAGEEIGNESTATGMTRDLSGTGVFVHTSRLPSVGEKLSLTVHLAPQKTIDLTGEVVRVLGKDEARQMALRPGFAARVTDPSGTYSFLVRSHFAP